MASSTKATLGGKPLLGSAEVVWTSTAGVAPFSSEVSMIPGDAAALLSGSPSPIELSLKTLDAPEIKIKGLYALERRPGPNPNVTSVRISDRRWFWPSVHIGPRRYNIRRTVGVKRVGDDGQPVTQPVVDEVAYHPASLKDKRTWRVDEKFLKDVINEVLRLEQQTSGQAANLLIQDTFRDLPVENLVIDDDGASAISRLLKLIPELQITVDPDGTVRVFSRAGMRESAVVGDDVTGPPIVGRGVIEFLTKERIRPREVHVLFTPEYEVRFDFEEAGGGTTARGSDDRFTDNVLPLPDFELEVGGRTLTRGAWVPITSELFTAWGAVPGFGVLSNDIIRRAMVPYMDLWGPLRLAGSSAPDADWMARIATLQQHWRKTYRINRRWLDRILSVEAYRVATVDPTTGTRAPAPAYADFSYMHSQRSFAVQAKNGVSSADLALFMNVTGYPSDELLKNAKPAPAVVQVIDSDQGIIRLDFLVDQNRIFEMALPSKLDNVPTADILIGTTTGAPLTFDSIEEGRSAVPALSATHKVAIVVTCVTAYPNDDRQLVRLKRKPSDISGLVPSAMRGGLNDARGPVMEVRIGPGLETARVGWSDDRATDIEKAFGVRNGTPKIDDLIVNKQPGNKGASLESIADAVAATVYAGFADRHEGGKSVRLVGAILDGFLDTVSHRVEAITGKATSSLALATTGAEIEMTSLLPDSERRILMGQVRPGKGT